MELKTHFSRGSQEHQTRIINHIPEMGTSDDLGWKLLYLFTFLGPPDF